MVEVGWSEGQETGPIAGQDPPKTGWSSLPSKSLRSSFGILSGQFELTRKDIAAELRVTKKELNASLQTTEGEHVMPEALEKTATVKEGEKETVEFARQSTWLRAASVSRMEQPNRGVAPEKVEIDLKAVVSGKPIELQRDKSIPVAEDFPRAEGTQVEHETEELRQVVQPGKPAVNSARTPVKVRTDRISSQHDDQAIGSEQAKINSKDLNVVPVRPVPEMPSVPVEPGIGVTAVGTKADESQSRVNTAVSAARGADTSDIEYVQAPAALETDPKPGGYAVTSERAQATPEIISDVTSKAPVPEQPARTEVFQFVVRPVAAGKSLTHQVAIGTVQSERGSEKTHSPELQNDVPQGVDALPVQAHPGRESFVETVAGKGTGAEPRIPAAEVVQQIVRHVEARIQNRSTEMHLQLNPKELGAIDVHMVSSPQGVSVTFSAEQPATGRLLETQLNQLHQSLTDAGVQIAGLNIGQHGQPRQEGGFLNQSQQFFQPTPREASLKEADLRESRPPLLKTAGLGEVDYLI